MQRRMLLITRDSPKSFLAIPFRAYFGLLIYDHSQTYQLSRSLAQGNVTYCSLTSSAQSLLVAELLATRISTDSSELVNPICLYEDIPKVLSDIWQNGFAVYISGCVNALMRKHYITGDDAGERAWGAALEGFFTALNRYDSEHRYTQSAELDPVFNLFQYLYVVVKEYIEVEVLQIKGERFGNSFLANLTNKKFSSPVGWRRYRALKLCYDTAKKIKERSGDYSRPSKVDVLNASTVKGINVEHIIPCKKVDWDLWLDAQLSVVTPDLVYSDDPSEIFGARLDTLSYTYVENLNFLARVRAELFADLLVTAKRKTDFCADVFHLIDLMYFSALPLDPEQSYSDNCDDLKKVRDKISELKGVLFGEGAEKNIFDRNVQQTLSRLRYEGASRQRLRTFQRDMLAQKKLLLREYRKLTAAYKNFDVVVSYPRVLPFAYASKGASSFPALPDSFDGQTPEQRFRHKKLWKYLRFLFGARQGRGFRASRTYGAAFHLALRQQLSNPRYQVTPRGTPAFLLKDNQTEPRLYDTVTGTYTRLYDLVTLPRYESVLQLAQRIARSIWLKGYFDRRRTNLPSIEEYYDVCHTPALKRHYPEQKISFELEARRWIRLGCTFESELQRWWDHYLDSTVKLDSGRLAQKISKRSGYDAISNRYYDNSGFLRDIHAIAGGCPAILSPTQQILSRLYPKPSIPFDL